MNNEEMAAKLLIWIGILKKEMLTCSEAEVQVLLRNTTHRRYLVFSSAFADVWAYEMQRIVDSLRRKQP